ncbi:hypothetical protein [Luteibacter sp. SG786]|uniref:DUF6931 family protein n=1 Tax=Luteibacter sp. SG786 TaxID=2587130 RepID=UPI0014214F77|nr:hypothetical protein [Luteibacter sp. SG786]NII54093.1 hypothetical protein [Luteibacter sp. SG786]
MTRPSLPDVALAMGVLPSSLTALRPGATAVEAIRVLLDEDQPGTGLRLLAGWLPRAYVVPWACQCVRDGQLSALDTEGLTLAEAWLRHRRDADRASALAFATRHAFVGIGPMLAASAGWSAGDLTDAAGKPMGPVPPPLMPRMAVGAVLLAATSSPAFASCCRAFAEAGLTLLPTEES